MADKILRDREKALEESFFAKQNEKLLEALRKKQESARSRDELENVSGIADSEVLGRLVELDIGAETWAAISLVPLVEVAWANGRVDDKERRAVMATLGSPDQLEGMRAFLEKRKPRFNRPEKEAK